MGGVGDDYLDGSDGEEGLYGREGNDTVIGGIGDDFGHGGAGNDSLDGEAGDDSLQGNLGDDRLVGSAGDDSYFVDSSGDAPVETRAGKGGGDDKVHAALSWRLGDNLEQLALLGTARRGSGNALDNQLFGSESDNRLQGLGGDDTLRGGAGADSLSGGAGADALYGDGGRDTLSGGSGGDRLNGKSGSDLLVGGHGHDVFEFYHLSDSTPSARDTIAAGGGAAAFSGAGSAAGDRIDMSGIDANSERRGEQSFIFGDEHGIGPLWAVNVGSHTVIRGNIDGDGRAEFEVSIDDGAVRAEDYSADDFFV